jgi:hypothetical protein
VNTEESTAFKALVKPELDWAIEQNGGIDRCREMYRDIPAMLYFFAGIVFGQLAPLTQEEVRRVLDLVRLRLESGSATS